jgi:hypothetical protein
MYFLGGCFRSRCYHHPTEIQSRLRFKLFFVGDDVPKNEKEEKQRRKRSFGWALIPTPLPYQGSEEEYKKEGRIMYTRSQDQSPPKA